MKLNLAPIPFYWPKEKVYAFYEAAEHWPVDRVIVGETICSKRRELRIDDWLVIAKKLQGCGKEVVISSLALIESESEFHSIKQLSQLGLQVEANDLGAVEIFHDHNVSFSGGHFLNIYNIQTLNIVRADGLKRWTVPIELGKDAILALQKMIQKQSINIETEIFVHGYLPLALSARCFTARALDRDKDHCERVCIDYPNGIPVDSQQGERLFTINGIQTLSGSVMDLLPQVAEIQDMGITNLRISPSCFAMGEIIEQYDKAIQKGTHQPAQKPHPHAEYCNGYWFGSDGMRALPNDIIHTAGP